MTGLDRWRSDIGKDPGLEDTPDLANFINDKEIMSNLKSISDRYDSTLRAEARAYAEESLRTEFETDEALMEQVRDSLDDKYEGKKGVLEARHEEERTSYEVNRAKPLSEKEEKGAQLEAQYEKALGRNLDKMTRQGISHSSIATLSEGEIDAGYRAARKSSDGYYDQRVKSYDEKIARLNSSYEAALKNYEITYAIELEKKVADLKAKRDKLVEKYEKSYDAEFKKAYRAYLEQAENDALFYEKETGDYAGAKKENYEERYNYLLESLKGKNQARVTDFLASHERELKSYLGLYYEKLLKEVG